MTPMLEKDTDTNMYKFLFTAHGLDADDIIRIWHFE